MSTMASTDVLQRAKAIMKEPSTMAMVSFLVFLIASRNPYSKFLKRYSLPAAALFMYNQYLQQRPNGNSMSMFVSGTHQEVVVIQDSLLTFLLPIFQIRGLKDSKVLNRLLGDILGVIILNGTVQGVNNMFSFNPLSFVKFVKNFAYDMVKPLPIVQKELAIEREKLRASLKHELKEKVLAMGPVFSSLPEKGMTEKEIIEFMKKESDKENSEWSKGKVSGSIYHGVASHQHLLNQAFSMYSLSNPLHPEIWPSGMKFDSEIISMTASLVNGGDINVCGCTTSGGTESIILAIKAHRDFYRDRHGITSPELVACTSAHAAVDKACDMMGIKHIKIPMRSDNFEMDLQLLERSIGPNTIMMYASAPGYPQGVIDPIVAMGEIALKYDIGLHVDCCLGGFVLPFAKKLGYKVKDFDFSVPGVTSMSLDTHKYGYALKGSSVVLYKNKQLRHAQYFCFPDWTGGIYATPTIAGSRSGGLIAQTWASMVSLGVQGYCKHADQILKTTCTIAEGVKKIEGVKLLGSAEAMIVCFTGASEGKWADSKPPCIYAIGDAMSQRGWSLNTLQHPASLHLCCTCLHVGNEALFLKNLQDALDEVAKIPADAKKEGKAAVYGMASSLPEGPVNELLKVYNDVVLDC